MTAKLVGRKLSVVILCCMVSHRSLRSSDAHIAVSSSGPVPVPSCRGLRQMIWFLTSRVLKVRALARFQISLPVLVTNPWWCCSGSSKLCLEFPFLVRCGDASDPTMVLAQSYELSCRCNVDGSVAPTKRGVRIANPETRRQTAARMTFPGASTAPNWVADPQFRSGIDSGLNFAFLFESPIVRPLIPQSFAPLVPNRSPFDSPVVRPFWGLSWAWEVQISLKL